MLQPTTWSYPGCAGAVAWLVWLAAASVSCATVHQAQSQPQVRAGAQTAELPPVADAEHVSLRGPRIRVDETVPSASDMEARLSGPRAELAREMQTVVGRAVRPLTRKGEGLLGNLITDVMRAEAEQLTGQPVDLAFSNLGGMRADLAAGDITRGAIMEVLPFENTLVILELRGQDLQAMLDRSATHGGDPISGATFTVQDKRAVDVHVGGQPLDPQRVYRICTNDYIADGGGRYESLNRASNILRTGVLVRDLVLNHIQHQTAAGHALEPQGGPRVTTTGLHDSNPHSMGGTP